MPYNTEADIVHPNLPHDQVNERIDVLPPLDRHRLSQYENQISTACHQISFSKVSSPSHPRRSFCAEYVRNILCSIALHFITVGNFHLRNSRHHLALTMRFTPLECLKYLYSHVRCFHYCYSPSILTLHLFQHFPVSYSLSA